MKGAGACTQGCLSFFVGCLDYSAVSRPQGKKKRKEKPFELGEHLSRSVTSVVRDIVLAS